MNERGLIDLFSAMNSLSGPVEECPYYPCHFDGQDCSLCYCIFYPCFIYKFGDLIISSKGNYVWSCKRCDWVHRKERVEEIVTYFSSFPRQVLVEGNWEFFSRCLQEILFGFEVGYKIGSNYNIMPANFKLLKCRKIEEGSFLAVKLLKTEIKEVKEIKDFNVEGAILIPRKSGKKIVGHDGKNFIECDL
ncbi:MAG: cysteine-rich small domain-containing protein [Archaeoglobaceae archaeon]